MIKGTIIKKLVCGTINNNYVKGVINYNNIKGEISDIYIAPIAPIIYCNEALAYFSRMNVQPNDTLKKLIDKTIKDLKTAGIWQLLDVLVVLRGGNRNDTLLNWMSNDFNATAVNSPVFTTNVGYNTDGVSSYIKTGYIPSLNGNLYKLNDASFGYKLGGTVKWGIMGTNHNNDNSALFMMADNLYIACNNWSLTGGHPVKSGYNVISRDTSAHMLQMINNDAYSIYQNSVLIPVKEVYMLKLNNTGGDQYFANPEQILEMYWIGKSITQSQFLIFQSIMNTYFATL